jgi:DNA-directed RNA polymerase specialized sigma24 family protein
MDESSRERVFFAGSPKQFQTTCWSVILAARDGAAREARDALAALCGAYWYPLYAFVRRKGYDPEASQDLVQGFFARLLEKGDLALVDRAKGKFRSFLMAACSHYLANERDKERAKKRGGARPPVSLDASSAEGRYRREPVHDLTPERLFDRQWALTLLDQVLSQLEREMSLAGKSRQFAVLQPALLGGAERVRYADIAAALAISEQAARAAAHRLRRRYRDVLRNLVSATVDDPADVNDEISMLYSALAAGSA